MDLNMLMSLNLTRRTHVVWFFVIVCTFTFCFSILLLFFAASAEWVGASPASECWPPREEQPRYLIHCVQAHWHGLPSKGVCVCVCLCVCVCVYLSLSCHMCPDSVLFFGLCRFPASPKPPAISQVLVESCLHWSASDRENHSLGKNQKLYVP